MRTSRMMPTTPSGWPGWKWAELVRLQRGSGKVLSVSDQNIITDWKAYFEALGPGTPSPLSRDRRPMFEGPERCHLVFSRGLDLDARDMPEGRELLEWSREVWEVEGKPEMWVFINRAGPPWHVPAQPQAKPQKGWKA